MINTKAVRKGPTTCTLESSDILPVKIDNKYPNTDAIVWNIQIIHPKM
jgi:hypothetical protein